MNILHKKLENTDLILEDVYTPRNAMKSENRCQHTSLRQSRMRVRSILIKKAKSGNLPRQNGFTLIEIVVVLVIISIIAVYAISKMSININLPAEVDKMKSQLRYVQQIALCGDNTYTWRIIVNATSYTFTRWDGANSVNMTLPGATGSANNTVTLPTGITVTAGTGTINFDKWGSPGNTNINISLTDGSTSRIITVTKNTGFVQ